MRQDQYGVCVKHFSFRSLMLETTDASGQHIPSADEYLDFSIFIHSHCSFVNG